MSQKLLFFLTKIKNSPLAPICPNALLAVTVTVAVTHCSERRRTTAGRLPCDCVVWTLALRYLV